MKTLSGRRPICFVSLSLNNISMEEIVIGNETYAIRKMEIDDIESVLPMASTSVLNPWSREMFLGEITHPHSNCFLLCKAKGNETKTPIGFICFHIIEDESELLNICIHPQYRQKGLGSGLMKFFIEWCHRQGVKKYYLEVDPRNRPALLLYQSFHFHQKGMRKNFYQGRFEALLMERVG